MSELGVVLGAAAAFSVGAYTGLNVRRDWTHVPWLMLLAKPGLSGGKAAVFRHVLYLIGWSFGVAFYALIAQQLLVHAAVPTLAGIYPMLAQTTPPRMGLTSEVVAATAVAITAWLRTRQIVNRRYKIVPTAATNQPTTPPPTASLPAGASLRRLIVACRRSASIVSEFLLFILLPLYDHLWHRDGHIIRGCAAALLNEFGPGRVALWCSKHRPGKSTGTEPLPELIRALQDTTNGGYSLVRTHLAMLQNEKRHHDRLRVIPPLEVRLCSQQDEHCPATLLDHSLGGVALVHERNLNPPSQVTLSVGTTTFDMEVVHCAKRHRPKGYAIGLRYSNEFAAETAFGLINKVLAERWQRDQGKTLS